MDLIGAVHGPERTGERRRTWVGSLEGYSRPLGHTYSSITLVIRRRHGNAVTHRRSLF